MLLLISQKLCQLGKTDNFSAKIVKVDKRVRCLSISPCWNGILFLGKKKIEWKQGKWMPKMPKRFAPIFH